MNQSVANILLSAIIGDAAGYTLNGMKKNHIKAVFRNMPGYINPEPGLKNNIHRWKKAGLYSSISQNLLLTAACVDKMNFNIREYLNSIKNTPDIPGLEYGIFRDPGEAEKNFLHRIKNGDENQILFDRPCARIIPPLISFLLMKSENVYLTSVLDYVKLFTKSSSTLAYSIFMIHFLKDLTEKKRQSISETAVFSAEKTSDIMNNNQSIIFNSGMNPDYMLAEIKSLTEVLNKLTVVTDMDTAEQIICSMAEKKYNFKITRAGINLPETIVPMAVMLTHRCSDPETIFSIAANEGGASSALASLSGSITTAFHGLYLPEILETELINKKKINSYIELISEGKNRASIITELYLTEPGLTLKEHEEYKSKIKKQPVINKKKNKKTMSETEAGISRHIVESWTKLDKAKWKKERKKEKL